jgi:hypothetical protein
MQTSWFVEMLDYVGNRREVLDSKSVLVDLPIGRNELSIPIGSPPQQGEPIGDRKQF